MPHRRFTSLQREDTASQAGYSIQKILGALLPRALDFAMRSLNDICDVRPWRGAQAAIHKHSRLIFRTALA